MAKYTRRSVANEVSKEENILIGAIVSSKFLRDLSSLVKDNLDLIKSVYLRIPIAWCLTYYKTYEKAPEESIMDIFLAEKESLSDEDAEMIKSALENVNRKYIEEDTRFDADYHFSITEIYLRGRNVKERVDKINGLVSQSKVLEAEKEFADFKRIERGDIVGIDILSDSDAVDDMFLEEESVMKMDGDLGRLMGDIFYGDLIYVGGPSKASKTWTSMEIAIACIEQGLNVAWVSLEMSARLMNKRFAQRIVGGSFREIEGQIRVPSFNEDNQIVYKKKKVPKLDPAKVKRKYKLFKKEAGHGKLVVYDGTSSGNTISSIKNTLITAEELEGIKFNVLIVDQLNLIKMGGFREKRHLLDQIALELKRDIAQEMNMLVISPIQYNRASLKNDTNDAESISEAYSLYTHASLLLSLNQSREERERGIMRITCSGRHSNYHGTVVVLQCLDLGRAIMDSKWLQNITNYSEIVTNTNFDDEDLIDLEDV